MLTSLSFAKQTPEYEDIYVIKKIAVAVGLSLWVISACLADGGTLTFTDQGTPGRSKPAAGYNWSTSTTVKASVRLPVAAPVADTTDSFVLSDEPQSVFVLSDMNVMVSEGSPRRVFSDLNGDKECQAEEMGFSPRDNADEMRIPLNLGVTASDERIVDTTVYIYTSSRYCSLTVFAVAGHYEGEIELAGNTYPARLDFANPMSKPSKGLVSLDCDADGEFASSIDLWFDPEFGVVFDGVFYESSLTCRDATAEIRLVSTDESMGTLSLKGEGIVWASVRNALERPLFLPRRDSFLYRMPVGDYKILACLLNDRSEPPNAFQLNVPSYDLPGFQIPADATHELALGGPLSQNIVIESKPLLNLVFLDNKGLKNGAGFVYDLGERGAEPRYQIKNRRGDVVAKGKFEFG